MGSQRHPDEHLINAASTRKMSPNQEGLTLYAMHRNKAVTDSLAAG